MSKYFPGSLIVIITGLILSFSSSCTPLSCFEETESFLKASFYDYTTKLLRAPDSLTIYGLNKDSILYNNVTKVQQALIPLNASASSSVYIIIINGITDTLEFRYSSFPHLVSKECGYTFYHHLDTEPIPTTHAINYIFTANSNITTLNGANINIFY